MIPEGRRRREGVREGEEREGKTKKRKGREERRLVKTRQVISREEIFKIVFS